MLENQVLQGNNLNIYAFEESLDRPALLGGFDWIKTNDSKEPWDFWNLILNHRIFSEFYKTYPELKNEVVVEMTMAEIENLVGYKVKIVE